MQIFLPISLHWFQRVVVEWWSRGLHSCAVGGSVSQTDSLSPELEEEEEHGRPEILTWESYLILLSVTIPTAWLPEMMANKKKVIVTGETTNANQFFFVAFFIIFFYTTYFCICYNRLSFHCLIFISYANYFIIILMLFLQQLFYETYSNVSFLLFLFEYSY